MLDLGQMTSPNLCHCNLLFQRSSEVTDLGWPHTYFQGQNWRCFRFLGVLRPHTWTASHIGLFLASLHRIRRQSPLLTQFTLRGFFRWGWRPPPGCYTLQILSQDTLTTRYFVQNWTENTLMKMEMFLRLIQSDSEKCIQSEIVNSSGGWNRSCMDRPALESQWNVVSPLWKSKSSTSYRRSYRNVKSKYQEMRSHYWLAISSGKRGIYLYFLEF